jgi:hypothetical protein
LADFKSIYGVDNSEEHPHRKNLFIIIAQYLEALSTRPALSLNGRGFNLEAVRPQLIELILFFHL